MLRSNIWLREFVVILIAYRMCEGSLVNQLYCCRSRSFN